MSIRPPAPSRFRPTHAIDQTILAENKALLEKIDRRGIAPFDPDNLGAKGRQDARGLRADLQPGQVDNSNAVECAALFSGIISHLPSPSS